MEFFKIRRDIPFMRHALAFNAVSLITFLAAVFFSRGVGNLWYGRKKKLQKVSIGQVWKPAAEPGTPAAATTATTATTPQA